MAETLFACALRIDDAAAQQAGDAWTQNSDTARNMRCPIAGSGHDRQARIDDRDVVEIGEAVQDEATEMVVGAAEDDVAGSEQTSDRGICQCGLGHGDLGSQAHLLDVVLENGDFGLRFVGVAASRAVQAVEVGFRDGIGVYQQKTPDAGPGQKYGDCAASAAAADYSNAKSLKEPDRFEADRECLALEEGGVNCRLVMVGGRAGLRKSVPEDTDGSGLGGAGGTPNPRLYSPVAEEQQAGEHLLRVAVAALENVSEMGFVLVVLAGEWRAGVRMAVTDPRMKILLSGFAQQTDVAVHVPADRSLTAAHASGREKFNPVNGETQIKVVARAGRPRVVIEPGCAAQYLARAFQLSRDGAFTAKYVGLCGGHCQVADGHQAISSAWRTLRSHVWMPSIPGRQSDQCLDQRCQLVPRNWRLTDAAAGQLEEPLSLIQGWT